MIERIVFATTQNKKIHQTKKSFGVGQNCTKCLGISFLGINIFFFLFFRFFVFLFFFSFFLPIYFKIVYSFGETVYLKLYSQTREQEYGNWIRSMERGSTKKECGAILLLEKSLLSLLFFLSGIYSHIQLSLLFLFFL